MFWAEFRMKRLSPWWSWFCVCNENQSSAVLPWHWLGWLSSKVDRAQVCPGKTCGQVQLEVPRSPRWRKGVPESRGSQAWCWAHHLSYANRWRKMWALNDTVSSGMTWRGYLYVVSEFQTDVCVRWSWDHTPEHIHANLFCRIRPKRLLVWHWLCGGTEAQRKLFDFRCSLFLNLNAKKKSDPK